MSYSQNKTQQKVSDISESKKYNWNERYLQGARDLQSATEIAHLDCSLHGKKHNDRRALNIDIFLEAGQPALKYISHMVPYSKKYELFYKLSANQLKWDKWDTIKQSYAEHKTETVMYGKCQHRTRDTRILARQTVPHCVAGFYQMPSGIMMAHLLLFDKEYQIELSPDNLHPGKSTDFYIARGFRTGHMPAPELDLGI